MCLYIEKHLETQAVEFTEEEEEVDLIFNF